MLCFTTFQQGRCVLSEGLETRPSACRMISLLTTTDSKASLIQQRQQRISVCKLSMWQFSCISPYCLIVSFDTQHFNGFLFLARDEAVKSQVILHYDHGCCSRCLALLTYEIQEEQERERERQRLKEAQRGGVELFQVACILLPFDHYIIASHAVPAVHSCSHSCACAFSSSSSCR